ncbi:MAG: septal ring lytic transglycosylase RlpA family protein [Hyphomonadaceae bacterium]|jgi:rare lipoprotein A|nr:septal ring lytic transglycosylase RlpA family protein [Hyphomonadaceae bacterium]
MRTSFRWSRALGLGTGLLVVLSSACAPADRGREARSTPRTDAPVSPRVVPLGQPVPKGGGIYKVGNPYRIDGILYTPVEDPTYDRTGVASFYSEDFHGRKTANGEVFDMWALTAAHPTLPLPSYAYVTNLSNGRTLLVRLNDRGPYARGRVIDLSRASARLLGFEMQGTAMVRVRYAGRAPLNGDDHYEQRFLASQHWYRVAAWTATRPGLGR